MLPVLTVTRPTLLLVLLLIAIACCPLANTMAREEAAASATQTAMVDFPAEAEQALDAMVLAEGIEASLFAAEPLLANPVALTIDPAGRVYICETYRIAGGVEDNRNHPNWIDDDLAAKTIDDRLAYFKRHLRDEINQFTSQEDRICLLVDDDGDGRADRAQVFADGFNQILEGVGADALYHQGQVYYTCIPRLWSLKDENGDGLADQRTALHEGYGVRVSFFGHDLHGLCIGHDGRLYFSIGDRGFHVETDEGTVANPETGAVFRCELDGSDLEVFAYGLRNPQDLAFDEFGNLFTGDNNSDGGDRARWVHVLEGSDSGWRMPYQYLGDRGPWNRDRLWEPQHPDQPAYIVPPVANIGDGPSGLAYYPGTGLPDRYQGNFFLCDFRAQSQLSGIRTFKVKPHGATFSLIDAEIFAWNCLPTDCKFGPDGRLYATDWIEGWNGTGKGRVFCLTHAESLETKGVKEVGEFLVKDPSTLTVEQLTRLLAHPDMRLRRLGQFELARREDHDALLQVLADSSIQLARMHALWALAQIARTGVEHQSEALESIPQFAHDVDPEIRVIALTALGEAGGEDAGQLATDALEDPTSRVRYAAAIALGKLGHEKAVVPLVQMLQQNAGQDPALRHGGIMGLVGCANPQQLGQLKSHSSQPVRRAAVVALRRLHSTVVAEFLADASPSVAGEAARAIYDVSIVDALPQLAARVELPLEDREAMRRCLAANFRLGQPTHAEALARYAATTAAPAALRAAALDLLQMWQDPPKRDPILGMWRPIGDERDPQVVVEALTPFIDQLVTSDQIVRLRFTQLAADYHLDQAAELLMQRVFDTDYDARERAGMLLALVNLNPPQLAEVVDQALNDAPRVRAAARIALAQTDPQRAVPALVEGFQQGDLHEKQSAATMLGWLGTQEADEVLGKLIQAYRNDQLPKEVRLDVLEAVGRRSASNEVLKQQLDEIVAGWSGTDRLAPFRDAMHGGDAQRGEELFFTRVQLECSRCHQVATRGGTIGPPLDEVGTNSREYLLESIVDPNKSIAKDFESVVLETADGLVVTGIVKQRDADDVQLVQADGQLVTVAADTIEGERRGQSAMPENLIDKLTTRDLRDLIEYMSGLRKDER